MGNQNAKHIKDAVLMSIANPAVEEENMKNEQPINQSEHHQMTQTPEEFPVIQGPVVSRLNPLEIK